MSPYTRILSGFSVCRTSSIRLGVKSLIDLCCYGSNGGRDMCNGGRWYVCYFTKQYLSNLHSCHTSEIKAKSDFTAQEDFFPALRTTPGIDPTDR